MSVRTEPRDLSQQLHQTLTIPADVMTAGAMVGAPAPGSGNEHHLHEANTFNTNNEHHPLERTVCINIRASLSDLCLRANTATWSPPSSEATKSIFQQAPKSPPKSPALNCPINTNKNTNTNTNINTSVSLVPLSALHRRYLRRARVEVKKSSSTPVTNRRRPTPPPYPAALPRTPPSAAHCADRPYVGGVRSASSWTSVARRRTRAISRASCSTR
mgnify:FL=1